MPRQWKEKAWKIASTLGAVASPDAPEEAPSTDQEATPTSNMFVLEDMEQAGLLTLGRSRSSTSSANTTISNGFMNTGWTESPLRAVEDPSLISADFLPMEFLPETQKDKLISLANDMGVDPYALISEILSYYVENEHELADIGTVEDAVNLYLDNEVLI